jgi:tRNA (guanine-N7-)-methyltransferase
MGKNKLPKFSEIATFPNVLQVPFSEILHSDHKIKGNWKSNFFGNEKPLVLELGCGKGEYTVGLAQLCPQFNYIGIDIKGSRMWAGAKFATENQLSNVGFLRMHIEMINRFFAPDEVDQIWLTFPDPQMKRTRKRLTSTRFIDYYRRFLKPGGTIHLKTDSNFQYLYTLEMIKANHFKIISHIENVYSEPETDPVLNIRTFYENQWIGRGLTIKYISFVPHREPLVEPQVEIEPDPYRSFGRGTVPTFDQ